jgi:hypothetical protein
MDARFFWKNVSVVTAVNRATNETCLMVPRTTHSDKRVVHNFFYGVTEEQLRPELGFRKRKLFKVQLCSSGTSVQMRHHLNLYPVEIATSRVKLTVHRNPRKLKGEVVRKFPLNLTEYFLVETSVL